MIYLAAQMSVASGISPGVILDLEPELFDALHRVLMEQSHGT